MKKLLLLVLPLTLALTLNTTKAQNFYDINTIQQIEITFTQPNWDYILDTAKQGFDTYTMAQEVVINGISYDSAGVKYKGNSSYNPTNAKNPIHIELDHFKEHDYYGLKDIKLSNGFHEPSSVREVLLYKMARQYMPSSGANYAQVTINNTLWGLYTNVEAVTKTFLQDRFYSDNNVFVFADNGGCNLVYKGPDTTMYYNPYTIKSDYGYTRLMNLCDTLRNDMAYIENILDVDRAIWMMAFTNVTVTLDSYIGQSTHNYYSYEDHNKRFNMILWDLNGGFGVFNKAQMGPGLTTPQMQTMSPTLHAADTLWPLVRNILAVPMYKRMYIAHMKTILNENFVDSSYYTDAQNLQTLIDTAIISDPNAFYTHTEFITNLTNTVVDGMKSIPGLTELMEARKTFLNGTPDFMQIAPVINSVTASDTTPLLGANIYITANVTGAATVYLGRRGTVMDKFMRVQMFDDGLNGDGAAGDNVYGAPVTMNESTLQYYIYADNANAGKFSPQRAEYEYYTIMIEKGVVLNELEADNVTSISDPYGDYDDWIELYNNSTATVDLSGYHLSDVASQPLQWTFPAGTMLAPGAFLVVWADEDTLQTTGLHANFKLSNGGETVLFSNAAGQLIDEIAFPPQNLDMTYGRYVNGTGAWTYMYHTCNTFNSAPVAVTEIDVPEYEMNIYPNPANSVLTIEYEEKEEVPFFILNMLGSVVYKGSIQNKTQIDLSNFSTGMYFIRIKDQTKKLMVWR